FGAAVVHFDRHADDQGPLRLAEALENAPIQLNLLGGHFQLPAGHLKGRRILEDWNRLVWPIVIAVENDPVLMTGSRDGIRRNSPVGFDCGLWSVVRFVRSSLSVIRCHE